MTGAAANPVDTASGGWHSAAARHVSEERSCQHGCNPIRGPRRADAPAGPPTTLAETRHEHA